MLLVVWYAAVHGPSECEGAWRYDVAVGGLLGAFATSFTLEVAVSITSGRVSGGLNAAGVRQWIGSSAGCPRPPAACWRWQWRCHVRPGGRGGRQRKELAPQAVHFTLLPFLLK